MAIFGYQGSTLCAELNRLANGGASYPALFLDEVGAANKWAGTSGLGILGALNAKAGNTTSDSWRALNGVCNQLAGTTALEARSALAQRAS